MSKKNRHGKKRTISKRRGKKEKKIAVKRSGEKKKTTINMTYIIITLIGLVSSVIGIWLFVKPCVSVHIGDPKTPSNPVLTPFVIHNGGHLAIRDVKCSNSIIELVENDKDVTIIGPEDHSDRFYDIQDVASAMAPGANYSIQLALSKLKSHQFGRMDILIVISFRPIKWLSRRKESLHRFETRRGEDGQWHWQPLPINK